jgi:hypothetical protein
MLMRWMKWIGVLSAFVLAVIAFMPWVVIVSKNITVTGVDATGTNFGKPAYFHFFSIFFFLLFTFIQKVWAKRINLLVTALNLAWAIRNYLIITMCRGGECPEKKTAIYLVLLTSALMLLTSLMPDIRTSDDSETN